MYALQLYDATYLYLTVLNESIAEGASVRDGRDLFNRSRNRKFKGEH